MHTFCGLPNRQSMQWYRVLRALGPYTLHFYRYLTIIPLAYLNSEISPRRSSNFFHTQLKCWKKCQCARSLIFFSSLVGRLALCRANLSATSAVQNMHQLRLPVGSDRPTWSMVHPNHTWNPKLRGIFSRPTRLGRLYMQQLRCILPGQIHYSLCLDLI